MKTIKIIDLLNKIANGEEVPKTIKVYGHKYQYANDMRDYKAEDIEKYWLISNFIEYYIDLTEEVEVIEDTPKEYINVSEEQVLFNNLGYEEQQFILKQMRMLQPSIEKANGE